MILHDRCVWPWIAVLDKSTLSVTGADTVGAVVTTTVVAATPDVTVNQRM